MKNILSFDLEYWYDSEFVHEKSEKDFILLGLLELLFITYKTQQVSGTEFLEL